MTRSRLLAAAAAGLTLLVGPARAACTLTRFAELPVTMSGMRPLVPVKINGAEVMMIADSGAFYSLISPGAAAQLHLQTVALPFDFRLRGVGGEVDASVATVKTFTLARADLHNVQFIVGGSESGSDSAGLLGQNVLRLADVEYDLGSGAIRLMRPNGCERGNLAYWSGTGPYGSMDIRRTDPLEPYTIGTVVVNGVRLSAMFDTGAESSVLALSGAARAGVRPDMPGVVPAGYTRGIGRRPVRSWIAPVKSFEIGGETVTNSRLRIGDVGLDKVDMLIGADFFLSHRVYVANSQSKLFFTYRGGPVFDLSRTPEAKDAPAAAGTTSASAGGRPAEPGDADSFARRGAAFAARRDYGRAIADFTRAIALAPDQPSYPYRRALARIAAEQPFLAMADLDAALKLKPDDVEARMTRARLRLVGRDLAGGRADLDAAAAASAKEADSRLGLALLYSAADLFEPAVAQLDLWIASHPQDNRLAVARNGRCWARAQLNRDLDKALADCDAALRLMPRTSSLLDSRGLVRLRRGELDRAIADYDAALALEPKQAWSLYGRGLARLRKGLKAEGEADIAAATLIAPRLPERAKAVGLTP